MNRSTNFRCLPFNMDTSHSFFKTYKLCFICVCVETDVSRSLLQAIQQRLGWVGIFARRARSSALSIRISSVANNMFLAFLNVKQFSLVTSVAYFRSDTIQYLAIIKLSLPFTQ